MAQIEIFNTTACASISEDSIGSSFYFPLGFRFEPRSDLGIEAVAISRGEDTWEVSITSRKFSQSVCFDLIGFDLIGFELSDNYLHLTPGSFKKVTVRSKKPGTKLKGYLNALNATQAFKIQTTEAALLCKQSKN